MNILSLAFSHVIYQPIFNTLLYIQKIVPGHDLGISIIVVTVLIKAVLYQPSLAAIRSSRQLQSLQPKLKALQEQFKDNKEQLAKEQMKLYRENRVNPISSCLTPLIQLPVLIGLYQVFYNGIRVDAHGLLHASQLHNVYAALRGYYAHTSINTMFLHWVDMTKTHNLVLAALAGLTTWWQSSMLASPKEPKIPGAKDEGLTSAINKQTKVLLPIMMTYFSYRFPSGLALYWFVSTIFTIGQQYVFLRQHKLANSVKKDEQPT
ncbi:MAG: membrane protein insertase YidC [Candidatus Kerfeldbacteria bacterium]|nr:membrane protein insertase YidC [Candidatus Kerfeldbacteria bacterium]